MSVWSSIDVGSRLDDTTRAFSVEFGTKCRRWERAYCASTLLAVAALIVLVGVCQVPAVADAAGGSLAGGSTATPIPSGEHLT